MAGARRHEELDAWQLCSELKERIFAFTATGAASKDFAFRDQIRASACSAVDCLAEGFYRYYSREFARFCSMARGSLGEVMSQLQHAQKRQYLSTSEFEELWSVARRAMGKTTNLLKYLIRCKPKGGSKFKVLRSRFWF